jgi:hypothetical protein
MKKLAFVFLAVLMMSIATIAKDNPMVGGAPVLPTKDIVWNAVNSADHTTLVAAVKTAGLVETLQSPGPLHSLPLSSENRRAAIIGCPLLLFYSRILLGPLPFECVLKGTALPLRNAYPATGVESCPIEAGGIHDTESSKEMRAPHLHLRSDHRQILQCGVRSHGKDPRHRLPLRAPGLQRQDELVLAFQQTKIPAEISKGAT